MLFEWRLQDIERKANAAAPAYELAALRGDVDRLERTLLELGAVVDGLRNELASAKEEIQQLKDSSNG